MIARTPLWGILIGRDSQLGEVAFRASDGHKGGTHKVIDSSRTVQRSYIPSVCMLGKMGIGGVNDGK